MRSYATVIPLFWTRGSGKRLRGSPEAQVVALYLMTCPQSSMTGIYNLNIETLRAETGLTPEGASKGLRKCEEEHVAFYDAEHELVWVPALSHHQVGLRLGLGKTGQPDKRITGIIRALKPFAGHPFVDQYLERYADSYSFHEPAVAGLLKPLLEAQQIEPIRKPLRRGYVPDPDLVSDPDPVDPDPPSRSEQAPPAGLQERAEFQLRDPMAQTWDDPSQWPECREVFAFHEATWKTRPIEIRGKLRDPRLRVLVERFAEGHTVEALKRALLGAKRSEHIANKREFQTLETILRDAGTVAKYSALLDDAPSASHGPQSEVALKVAAQVEASRKREDERRRARRELTSGPRKSEPPPPPKDQAGAVLALIRGIG